MIEDELDAVISNILDSADAQSPSVFVRAILARWRLVPVEQED